jgi:hypothetical protein
VATRPSGFGGRTSEARIAVEAASCPQTDEYLARAPLESLLHFDGIVARVEDEQGEGLSPPEPTQQDLHLLGSDHIGILFSSDALDVHGSSPTLAGEVELCDELVGPSGHDRLACRVARRMVVEAALGATLCVASGPHARVHGVDWRFASGERMAGEQFSEGFGVDPSPPECGVEAAPTPTMRGLEAQVNGRRYGAVGGEDGIRELEESVAPAA